MLLEQLNIHLKSQETKNPLGLVHSQNILRSLFTTQEYFYTLNFLMPLSTVKKLRYKSLNALMVYSTHIHNALSTLMYSTPVHNALSILTQLEPFYAQP